MADFKPYFETLIKHEGGYVNNPNDRGGATKYGVTFEVWYKSGYDKDGDGDIDINDLKIITKDDAEKIAKKKYWDAIRADDIKNQSIAEFIFDWSYNSGTKTAINRIQQVLKIGRDGVVGDKTIESINNYPNQKELFEKLKERRRIFFLGIVTANPKQVVFLKGWLNRNNSFKFREQ